MPNIAASEVMPVPPTPAIRMLNGSVPSTGRVGIGSGRVVGSSLAVILRGLAPCTVTKLGQKPLTQEKSLLQLDWSIWRLRPNSVSTGSTDRQLDWVLQSPQ